MTIGKRLKHFAVTFPADASPQVVTELKGILDGDARRIPHLFELRQRLRLADRDDVAPANDQNDQITRIER